MKLLACWHIGKAKNVPFKLLLTTASAWVAAELAPLGSRVDFQGRCLQENEGFGKPYYWVTQKRGYFGCVSSFQEKFQLKAMRQKSQAQKGKERHCVSVQTSHRLLLQSPDHLGLNLWQWKRSDILELLPQTSQPTPNYPHCGIWIASTHLQTSTKRRRWMKESLCDGGCKAGTWEWTEATSCPCGTYSVEGNWLVCWAGRENHCSREVSSVAEVGDEPKKKQEEVGWTARELYSSDGISKIWK